MSNILDLCRSKNEEDHKLRKHHFVCRVCMKGISISLIVHYKFIKVGIKRISFSSYHNVSVLDMYSINDS